VIVRSEQFRAKPRQRKWDRTPKPVSLLRGCGKSIGPEGYLISDLISSNRNPVASRADIIFDGDAPRWHKVNIISIKDPHVVNHRYFDRRISQAVETTAMADARDFIHARRTAGVGASRPLRRIPAIVSFLNPQPAPSLVGGNRSLCP
jgi:hypothetical protein